MGEEPVNSDYHKRPNQRFGMFLSIFGFVAIIMGLSTFLIGTDGSPAQSTGFFLMIIGACFILSGILEIWDKFEYAMIFAIVPYFFMIIIYFLENYWSLIGLFLIIHSLIISYFVIYWLYKRGHFGT